MRARRSCLSVPGSSAKMLAKARALAPDEVIVDLEDSVVPAAKDEARAAVLEALREPGWAAASVSVRVNAADTRWCHRDVVDLVAGAGDVLASLIVPKVERAGDLDHVHRLATAAEAIGGHGRRVGLQALVETAAGLRRVHEIAEGCERLEALIVGYADLAASLGRRPGGPYPGDRWHTVRETVLIAARSRGVQAVDGPFLAIDDPEGLEEEAWTARTLGFDGKWALHPAQIEPLNRIFGPTREEFEQARAVLAALEGSAAGAVRLDGAMIDEASRKLAAQVVARGEAAGLGS